MKETVENGLVVRLVVSVVAWGAIGCNNTPAPLARDNPTPAASATATASGAVVETKRDRRKNDDKERSTAAIATAKKSTTPANPPATGNSWKKVSKSKDDRGALGSKIFPATTERELIKIYGRENVKRSKIPVGEGETVVGTVLFPGTTDEIKVEWKANFARPERITVSQGKRWRTKEGIAIGTTLAEVERANQGSFQLTGFEWDYPGRTVSWAGGKLDESLQLELAPTRKVGTQESQRVMGEGPYSSSLPALKKMKLKVVRIFVRW